MNKLENFYREEELYMLRNRLISIRKTITTVPNIPDTELLMLDRQFWTLDDYIQATKLRNHYYGPEAKNRHYLLYWQQDREVQRIRAGL